DPDHARQLLEQAGHPAVNGVRFHLTMKSSTEESTRLMAAVLQQQLREVGIALDIRTFEFATFFSDVTRGAFQFYSLRWIGGNEDPDIDRKSTRLNSSHGSSSYAVFCWKKKTHLNATATARI